jgi:stage II sporulation protein D
VLLADGKKRVPISSDKPYTVVDGNGKTDSVPAGSSSFGVESMTYPATFSAATGSVLSLSGHAYRGKFVLSLVNGKLRVINLVSLQQYLYGNVPAEMPSSWLPDALDVQAVASRSYALAGRKKGAAYDVLLTSQSYLGVAAETAKGNAAVDATKGQVLTYGGKVATTTYSSSTGGWTQSATDAWGGGAPYLVSVKDPYDSVSPWHKWGPVPVTGKTLRAALELSAKPVDATVKRNGSKRVAQLDVTTLAHGVRNHTTATGGTVAAAFSLRSTWFSVGVLSLLAPSPNVAVSPGTTVMLKGTVRGVKNVVLQQRPVGGGAWTQLKEVTPNPKTGAIGLNVTPDATTDYRLETAAAAAAPIRITVSQQ